MTESDLARGSYYWRIVTSKKSRIDTESYSWQFNLDVAGGEDGYTIQKDMTEYPSYDKFELKTFGSALLILDSITSRQIQTGISTAVSALSTTLSTSLDALQTKLKQNAILADTMPRRVNLSATLHCLLTSRTSTSLATT